MLLFSVSAVGLLTVGVVFGTALNARRTTVSAGDGDSDSQSFIGGVLSALFTIVLAFYIVFAWQNGDDIEQAAHDEGDALANTYWQATSAPQPQADEIQGLVEEYANRVINVEWAALDRGEDDPHVEEITNSLRAQVLSIPTDAGQAKMSREQSLQSLQELDAAHRERVDVATDDQNFNMVLLLASVLGAALMIAFPLLVGLSLRPANLLAMGLLTVTLGFTLYMSFELMYPFHGPFAVQPESFETVLDSINTTPQNA